MTFTKNIERKYAESARRRALELESPAIPLGFGGLYEAERRECVAIWNQFCVEDSARMATPKPRTYARILPGIWVESSR